MTDALPPEVVEARAKALRLLVEDRTVDLESLTAADMEARGLTMRDLYAVRDFRWRQDNPFGRSWEGIDPTKPWRGRAQMPITPGQVKIMALLKAGIEATGKSPTARAMAEALGISSGRVNQQLESMVRRRQLYSVGGVGGYRIPAPRIPIPLAPPHIRLATRPHDLTVRMPPATEALDYCRAIYELGPPPEEPTDGL